MALTRPRAHQLSGTSAKAAVRVVSESDVTLSGGAPATVDGVSLTLDDRILVTGQSTASQNGLYRCTVVGSGSNGTWVRSRDGSHDGTIVAGMTTIVTEGSTYADTLWKLTTDGTITIGTTALAFSQHSGGGGTPGGSDTQVQFNDSSSFGGDAGLTYNKTTDSLTIVGTMQADLVKNREQRYTTSNMMKFNQLYTGAAVGSYFTQNEYQKIVTIIPASNSENYQVSGRILCQNAGEIQTINFKAALRSGDPLPDLSWSITYDQEHNGTAHFKPQLWTKETTTAGFIVAIQKISSGSLYGTVTVDMDIIPRSSGLLDNVTVNTTQNSEQTSIDAGYTANDMTLVKTVDSTDITVEGDILNGQSDGVGNIGSSTVGFDTVHAIATSAQYADLAEKYTTDHDYEAGTVVVFGGNSEITQSTISHDRKVAGVISTNPAVKMNDGLDGQYLALQGRVPCKVIGPIEKGDLVVTSHVPGLGVKLDDTQYQPGCVIGKALESIEDQQEQVIEVVVGRL